MQSVKAVIKNRGILSKAVLKPGRTFDIKPPKDINMATVLKKIWKRPRRIKNNKNYNSKYEENLSCGYHRDDFVLGLSAELNPYLYTGFDHWPQRNLHTFSILKADNSNTEELKVQKGVSTKDEVEKLFEKFKNDITETAIGRVEATYQWNLTGPMGGEWYIQIKDKKMLWAKGKAPTTPDATFVINTDDFLNLFRGHIRAVPAFLMGKLKVEGNFMRALELERLFASVKYRK